MSLADAVFCTKNGVRLRYLLVYEDANDRSSFTTFFNFLDNLIILRIAELLDTG